MTSKTSTAKLIKPNEISDAVLERVAGGVIVHLPSTGTGVRHRPMPTPRAH